MGQIPPELIGKAVQDPDFRHRLLTDPQSAVTAAGFELDEDQIAALKQLDPEAIDEAIDALVGDIDSSKWG
ncbi:MAG: Os1348 family NHLP clan protein [Acidimicrobiia bacterium]